MRVQLGAVCVAACLASSTSSCDDHEGSGFPLDAAVDSGPDFGRNFGRNGADDDDGQPASGSGDFSEMLPPAVLPEEPETTRCGGVSCRDVLVGDIVVPPCCPGDPEDACGLDLAAASDFMPLQNACLALEQPGANDPACPSVTYSDAVQSRELEGCCRPSGECGVVADLDDLLANFGCVDPRAMLLEDATAGWSETSCTPPEPEEEPEPEDEPEQDDSGAGALSDAGPVAADASRPPSGASPDSGSRDAGVTRAAPDAAEVSDGG